MDGGHVDLALETAQSFLRRCPWPRTVPYARICPVTGVANSRRKILATSIVVAVLILAKVGTIVTWLKELSVLPLTEHIPSEYLTGTAIAVIVALLILLPSRVMWAVCVRCCPVCDAVLLRRGKCCGECGSRV